MAGGRKVVTFSRGDDINQKNRVSQVAAAAATGGLRGHVRVVNPNKEHGVEMPGPASTQSAFSAQLGHDRS